MIIAWLSAHLIDLIPIITGTGLLAHPKVRATLRSAWLGLFNRAQLISDIVRLNDHLENALDDANYWKESREDLDAKYDDLTQRFTEVRQQADMALAEITELKNSEARRKKLLTDFSADRDALLLWGRGLKDYVTAHGLTLPDTLLEPTLATAGIAQNILRSDTL